MIWHTWTRPRPKRLKTALMLPPFCMEMTRTWSSSLIQTRKFFSALCLIQDKLGTLWWELLSPSACFTFQSFNLTWSQWTDDSRVTWINAFNSSKYYGNNRQDVNWYREVDISFHILLSTTICKVGKMCNGKPTRFHDHRASHGRSRRWWGERR